MLIGILIGLIVSSVIVYLSNAGTSKISGSIRVAALGVLCSSLGGLIGLLLTAN